jgi:hypothetical protein
VDSLEGEKKNLLEAINKLQEELRNREETINRLERVSNIEFGVQTLAKKVEELLQIRVQKRIKPLYTVKEIEFSDCPPLEQLGMKDLSALSRLLLFLTPTEALCLALTNKRMRLLCNTHSCIRSLCRSIISLKNKKIGYYHSHISYFEKLREKVPTEILKTAYFRYHILKESAGLEIKHALNASSLIFEGRFEGEELYTGLPEFNKEIPTKLDFSGASILEVDLSIVDKFKEVRLSERDQLVKEFE